jgi:hypothetical protein
MAERRRDEAATPRRSETSGADADSQASAVQEVVQQLRQDFQARDRLYEATDKVLWGEYELNVPDNYRETTVETRSPLQQNMASTIAAALSVNQAQVSFEPVGRGQQAQLNAEARQHFFEASFRRQESEARRQLLRLFIWSLVTKGEGTLKTLERTKRAWAGYGAYSKSLERRLDDPDDPEYGELARKGDEGKKRAAYDEATERYKMGRPYPIATTDVPPESFYYYLTPDGYRLCAEVSDVPYLDALDRFGAGLDHQGRVTAPLPGSGASRRATDGDAFGLPRPEWSRAMSGTSTLTLVEVWDWQCCRYVLLGPGQSAGSRGLGKGTLVRTVRHGYGDPWTRVLRGPYFHALGITTDSRLPERAGLSVLYPFLSLFPALDSYLTIQSNAAFLTGFPSFKRTQPPGGTLAASLGAVAGPNVAPFGLDGSERDALASQTTKIEAGTIYPWDVAPIEMPRSGVEIDKVIAAIMGFLELGLPASARGAGGADDSGYAINQKTYLARLAWDPIVSNAQFALSERVGFESWLIERKIGEKVYAYEEVAPGSGRRGSSALRAGWQGIGPEDLKGAHRYTVTLDPETPANKTLEIRSHVEMVKAGFESTAMAIEALGGDPGEVERELLMENLKRDPAIQNRLKQRVFQKLGLLDEETLGAVGGVPPAGAPPGLPPQLAALLAQGGPGGPPGLGPGAGGPGAGQLGINLPGPQAPGYGMPLTPPPTAAVAGANGAAGLPSNPAGGAVQPGLPAAHRPLPGQGPV